MDKQNPGDYEILLNMGLCYDAINDVAAAEKQYLAAARVRFEKQCQFFVKIRF